MVRRHLRGATELRHPTRLSLVLIAAIACGGSAGARADGSLTPDAADSQPTVLACTDGVLAASPMVERFSPRREDNPRTRYVVLRNPPSERATGLGIALEPRRGTPRQLVAVFSWPRPWKGTGMVGPIDPKLADMEGEALTEMGSTLLRDIRAQCAPTAPGEVACTRVEQGRTQRCVLAV